MKKFEIKVSYRIYFMYEKITGKSFPEKPMLMDWSVLMYACYLGTDDTVTFDQFIDLLDAEPTRLNDFIIEFVKKAEVFGQSGEEKKKKVKVKN